MEKTLRLLDQKFESSSGLTKQFDFFFKVVRRELKEELEKNIGIVDFEMHRGHFYFSGFFTTLKNRHYYFYISDVRYFKEKRMLIRTAKDYKDFTGGPNNYIGIKEGMFKNFSLPRWKKEKKMNKVMVIEYEKETFRVFLTGNPFLGITYPYADVLNPISGKWSTAGEDIFNKLKGKIIDYYI